MEDNRIRELLTELKTIVNFECEEFKKQKKTSREYIDDNFPKLMALNSELKMMSNTIVRACNIG